MCKRFQNFKNSEHANISKKAQGNYICKDTKMRKMPCVLIRSVFAYVALLAWNAFCTFMLPFLRMTLSLFSTTETYSCGLKPCWCISPQKTFLDDSNRESFPAPNLCVPLTRELPHWVGLSVSVLASAPDLQGWRALTHHWSSPLSTIFCSRWDSSKCVKLNWGESLKFYFFIISYFHETDQEPTSYQFLLPAGSTQWSMRFSGH